MFTKIKEYSKTCLERPLKHVDPDQPATSEKSRLDLNCLTRYICQKFRIFKANTVKSFLILVFLLCFSTKSVKSQMLYIVRH